MILRIGGVLGSLVLMLGSAHGAETDRVSVEAGVLLGSGDADVRIFKGVPYAAAPVGRLRWMPPQPAAHWTEPRPATEFGPACVQFIAAALTDPLRFGAAPEPDERRLPDAQRVGPKTCRKCCGDAICSRRIRTHGGGLAALL